MTVDIVDSLVEIKLKKDNFLVVKETLSRIGVANKDKKLFQSCYILQKRGKFYIVHFKELFLLDGKSSTYSDEDKGRRNTIVALLRDWDLIDVVDESKIKEPLTPIQKIKVIKSSEKGEWELIEKYQIGKTKKKETV
jgi:hypothetical protein